MAPFLPAAFRLRSVLYCVQVKMRAPGVVISLFACLLAAGCTSSGLDALAIRPSAEITNSIEILQSAKAASVEQGVETEDVAAVEPTPDRAGVGGRGDHTERTCANAKAAEARHACAGRTCRCRRCGGAAAHAAGLESLPPPLPRCQAVNFGKASPKNHAVHGVDVSRWQGDIDWEQLRSQGANFAYIKATDGGDHLDPMFKKNWRGAQQPACGAVLIISSIGAARPASRRTGSSATSHGSRRAAAGHRCRVE
jgi:lysozyme